MYPSRKVPEFCSIQCSNKSRTLEKIPCPICGEMFTPNICDTVKEKSVRKKHCSAKCAGMSRMGKPSTNPYTHPKEIINNIREMCKTKFAKEISDEIGISVVSVQDIIYKYCKDIDRSMAKKRQYDETSKRMQADNPMFYDVAKQKVSEWKKKNPEIVRECAVRASSKCQRNYPSKLELRAREILDEIGIDYESSVPIKDKFVVDFRIVNLIIEIDGEYWHGHPRFIPLSERQKGQQKRDKSRNKYLLACGYSVERIWERDVTKDHIISILKKHNII